MTKPIPEGFHTLTAHLIVTDGAAAIFRDRSAPERSVLAMAD